MSRVGINKALVEQARQAVLVRGEHPSIDAVRIELGNTGSKTTIHRYLKELEGQKPLAPGGLAALSEPLARLVEQLSKQLQGEAQARIEAAEAAFTEQRRQLEAQLQLAQQALAAAHQELRVQVSALAAESERLAATQHSLQTEQLRNVSLNQQLGELQQGIIVRQDEATRLHRDNERLQAEQRQVEAQCKVLNEQLEQRDAQVQGLRAILAQAQGASEEVRRQLQVQTQALEEKREQCLEQARQLERLQVSKT